MIINPMRSLYRFSNSGVIKRLSGLKDMYSAKKKIASSDTLTVKEKALLSKISLRIHEDDDMYVPFQAQHYLGVGLSAIRCIENALQNSCHGKEPQTILDFPCGYGRVLRFLKARFPEGKIIASELSTTALNYCRRVFGVNTVLSDKNISKVLLAHKFDLIWCGSLTTHLNEQDTVELLRLFYNHLSRGGMCVFTTHGQLSAERIGNEEQCYELTKTAQQEVLNDYYRNGYGYVDYSNGHGYGVSVVSRDRILAIAQSIGDWNKVFHQEHGWDNHQDVYAFTRPL